MLKTISGSTCHTRLAALLLCSLLAGCAANNPAREAPPSAVSSDAQRLSELERQLAERQRHCNEDKRRQELALKESQKQNEELQRKLDSLLAIDRELRNRSKAR